MLNKNGPKSNSVGYQTVFPTINYVSHLLVLGEVKPCAFSFSIRNPWLRMSNALERSVSRAPKILPLSTALFLFNNVRRHFCALKPSLKPHRCLKNISSKKEDICLIMLCS